MCHLTLRAQSGGRNSGHQVALQKQSWQSAATFKVWHIDGETATPLPKMILVKLFRHQCAIPWMSQRFANSAFAVRPDDLSFCRHFEHVMWQVTHLQAGLSALRNCKCDAVRAECGRKQIHAGVQDHGQEKAEAQDERSWLHQHLTVQGGH